MLAGARLAMTHPASSSAASKWAMTSTGERTTHRRIVTNHGFSSSRDGIAFFISAQVKPSVIHSTNTLVSFLPPNGADYELLSLFDPAYVEAARITQRSPPSESECNAGKCRVVESWANCNSKVLLLIQQARLDANLAIRTDSDTPRLLKPWVTATSFAAVGLVSSSSATGILIPFAISRDQLQPDSAGKTRNQYSVRLHITGLSNSTRWGSDRSGYNAPPRGRSQQSRYGTGRGDRRNPSGGGHLDHRALGRPGEGGGRLLRFSTRTSDRGGGCPADE